MIKNFMDHIGNKKIKTIALVALAYLFESIRTYAVQSNDQLVSPIKATSLAEFFSAIVDTMIQLGVVVSALAIMYGGFMLVTAQGDEEKVAQGRKTLTWAMVGTAVLLGAKVIFVVIKGTVDQLK